jgi:hypothetical protein
VLRFSFVPLAKTPTNKLKVFLFCLLLVSYLLHLPTHKTQQRRAAIGGTPTRAETAKYQEQNKRKDFFSHTGLTSFL